VLGTATASVVGTSFRQNTAQFGGAIAVEEAATLSIVAIDCTENSAAVCGGALAINSSQPLYTGGEHRETWVVFDCVCVA
jgi:predicted outer membrane repeat protein